MDWCSVGQKQIVYIARINSIICLVFELYTNTWVLWHFYYMLYFNKVKIPLRTISDLFLSLFNVLCVRKKDFWKGSRLVIMWSVIWLSRTALFCCLSFFLFWEHCGEVIDSHRCMVFSLRYIWNIRYCFFYTLWPHLGRPRGVNTERGLWCGAVCGHSRLWSDLHHMPRGPQMSSKSCVPPHFLQEMHLAVAKKVLNVSYQYPWTKVLPGFFIWSETHS